MPVFVTVTTDWVTVLLTRLLPKLKEAALNEAVVDNGGAALTVNAAVTLWESEPEVPWRAMLAVPAAAVGPAVTVICCSEPAVIDKVIGVAVTPVGSEPTVTLTFPVNPFVGEALIAIACAAPPGMSVIVEGTIASVKSAGNSVVDVLVPLFVELLPPPPLQPVKAIKREATHRKAIQDRIRSAPFVSITVLVMLKAMKHGRFCLQFSVAPIAMSNRLFTAGTFQIDGGRRRTEYPA